MASPSYEIWKLKHKGRGPTHDTHDNTGASVEEFVVQLVVTEVDIAGQREEGEAQESTETGGQAHAGHELTQPLLIVKELLPLRHTFKQT